MASNNQHGSSLPLPNPDDYFEITVNSVVGSSMTVVRSVRLRRGQTVELERVVSVSQRCRVPIGVPRATVQPPVRVSGNNIGNIPTVVSNACGKKVVHKDGNLIQILRKELSNSDVTSPGRIVLPKRLAEAYLPCLNDKDGVKLEMQDMQSNLTWEFKYRFWPNNKSRMYVLEHAGDFLKRYKLKTGDSVLIFKDVNNSKWMITFERSPSAAEEGEGTQDRGSASGNDDSKIQAHQPEDTLRNIP